MEEPETQGEAEDVRGEDLAQRDIAGQAAEQYSKGRLLDGLDGSKATSGDGSEDGRVVRFKC